MQVEHVDTYADAYGVWAILRVTWPDGREECRILKVR